MLKDITLGQYFPGETLVHNLDPRTKLIFTVIYIAALFTCKDFVSYALVFIFLAIVIYISRIGLKAIFRGMKPLLIIIVLSAVLNLFFTQGEPIAEFWIFKITADGIKRSVFMILRIFMLIAGTFLLTYTTSPMSLTDGLELLLNPLKIKVPVHEFAMMMSIALRFIPIAYRGDGQDYERPESQGADFDTGNILQKARAMLPLLIPLFISAFRRADELATAMESRCYHGGEGRTRMKRLVMVRRDYLALAVGLCLLASVITLRYFGL